MCDSVLQNVYVYCHRQQTSIGLYASIQVRAWCGCSIATGLQRLNAIIRRRVGYIQDCIGLYGSRYTGDPTFNRCLKMLESLDNGGFISLFAVNRLHTQNQKNTFHMSRGQVPSPPLPMPAGAHANCDETCPLWYIVSLVLCFQTLFSMTNSKIR